MPATSASCFSDPPPFRAHSSLERIVSSGVANVTRVPPGRSAVWRRRSSSRLNGRSLRTIRSIFTEVCISMALNFGRSHMASRALAAST